VTAKELARGLAHSTFIIDPNEYGNLCSNGEHCPACDRLTTAIEPLVEALQRIDKGDAPPDSGPTIGHKGYVRFAIALQAIARGALSALREGTEGPQPPRSPEESIARDIEARALRARKTPR
jgi:hypothetical protein